MEDSDFDNFECPECHNEGAYFNGSYYECPDCGREWDDYKVFKHGDEYQKDDTDSGLVGFIEKPPIKKITHLVNPCSFHGNLEEKFKYIDEVEKWLSNPIHHSDVILEDPEQFFNKLGLPIWLYNLLITIKENYIGLLNKMSTKTDKHFYHVFLSACNAGVDYSLMFHKWEISLFECHLPEQELERPIFKYLQQLHEKALSGLTVNLIEWQKLSNEVEQLMGSLDRFPKGSVKFAKKEDAAYEKLQSLRGTPPKDYEQQHREYCHLGKIKKAYGQITWDSYRAAFLSAQEAIDVYEVWTSSAEAIVDAVWQESLISGKGTTDNESMTRALAWNGIADHLLQMLREWEG